MYQAGLVLEGGGMKGTYTAGVLDYFLEQGIEFSSCYGVSAGAIQMSSFIAGQKGRGLRTTVDYVGDKNYCSFYSLLTTGDFFNADFCYRKIPDELDPVDNETFMKYQGKAYAVLTNIITGKPEYYQLKDLSKDIIAIRASSSLPLLARNVIIDGVPYLDGGISDSVPIRKSIADGNQKNVVVLTKEEGFVRKPSSHTKLIKLLYRKYPKVAENMAKRHTEYNEMMQFLEAEQKAGRVFVIRPKEELAVGRIEKDKEKLHAVYKIGYEDAKRLFPDMETYLNK